MAASSGFWRLASNFEVTGPGGNTTKENHKHQIADMKFYADAGGNGGSDTKNWYMLAAVEAHESLHESRLAPAMAAVEAAMLAKLQTVKIAVKDGESAADGKKAILASAAYKAAVSELRGIWDAKYVELIDTDHSQTPALEQAVVNPMIDKIEKHAKQESW